VRSLPKKRALFNANKCTHGNGNHHIIAIHYSSSIELGTVIKWMKKSNQKTHICYRKYKVMHLDIICTEEVSMILGKRK